MTKKPAREMRFFANKNTGIIEIVLLGDGQPLGSIAYTQEEAENFAHQLIAAIEAVQAAKSGILVPEKTAAGLTLVN